VQGKLNNSEAGIFDRVGFRSIKQFTFTDLNVLLTDFISNARAKPTFPETVNNLPSIFDFKIEDPANPLLNLHTYRGRKIIVVNTASACSYTPQYRDMQKVYAKHMDRLVVLGFPCNDYGRQEVLDDSDIPDFCSTNFGVSFPLFNRVKIKGHNPSPLFYWLRMKELNGWNDRRPYWNFWKYILNEKGQLMAVIPSKYKLSEENLAAWKV
jgi:glutathione peroxidase